MPTERNLGDDPFEDWPPDQPTEKEGWLSRFGRHVARALEAETDRWFLWLPVFFGAGIVLYFALSEEPDGRIALAFVLAALGLLLFLRGTTFGFAFGVALLATALGFSTSKLRTELVRAPVLASELRHVALTGYVERFEARADARDRLTLRVISLGTLGPEARPKRVRVSLAGKNTQVRPGEAVKLRATLSPPPEPVAPDGFDFARQAWFKQLGGLGYATSRITPLTDAPIAPLGLRLWAEVDKVRNAVKARVRAALPQENGAVAVALITGDRSAIPNAVTEAMRDAGLAHVLAISGLHMVIMAGSVFWLVRALLAAIPALALRFPVKKWAAAISLVAAALYLALSGASVPTTRAFLMMSIVMLAIMLDRPPITMRNVALAAMAILLFAPESLFDPSFQMSFAAVIGLVAAYEVLSARRAKAPYAETTPAWRGLRWAGAFIGGAGVTTLIAGTAVAPFAVYHFHRMTHYGIVANMIVVPLISLLIMPMALMSLITMPFGLEALPLMAMGYGIDLMVGSAAMVASWPGAVTLLPSPTGIALLLIAFGGLWLCLWQTRMRALGLVIIAFGLLLAPAANRPDILIGREGKVAALRSAQGSLIFPSATARSYSVEKWLLSDGDGRDPKGLPASTPFRCDPLGCVGQVKGKTVALIREIGALDEDCRKADIVIAPFKLAKPCRAARVVVDRNALQKKGAHALYIEGLSIRSETVAKARGARPWSHFKSHGRSDDSKTKAAPKGAGEEPNSGE